MSVKDYLTELKESDTKKYVLVKTLRELVLQDTNVTEEIKYGGVLFSKGKPFGGVFPYAQHVSMEFSHGAEFDDPEKLLEGSGKFRRHLKFALDIQVDEDLVKFFLKQAL
jgi:hypothetical protein